MKKILKRVFDVLLKKQNKPLIKYKIGNVKKHNSLVDTLLPQFIEIGNNFISAPGSIILAHDASLFVHTGKYRCERTKIGDNVFLGANAVILPGITVGDGAIIGAGSIVTKDIEPYTVVAGNPARFICSVQDYISKSENREVLFEAPLSFKNIFKGESINSDQVTEFQEKILSNSKV